MVNRYRCAAPRRMIHGRWIDPASGEVFDEGLAVFFAAPRALKALRLLSHPRPAAAPPGYPVWPRWFSTVAFIHNRWFGNLFILGVALDTALRLIFPAFWR